MPSGEILDFGSELEVPFQGKTVMNEKFTLRRSAVWFPSAGKAEITNHGAFSFPLPFLIN